MATQVKTSTEKLYDEDFYVWSQEQAELLRAGRFDALDLEHLIEEVEDLGGSPRSSVGSRATTIMVHLLESSIHQRTTLDWPGARRSAHKGRGS